METLPCGCHMWTDESTDTFIFEPHDLECKYYAYVLEYSAEIGKPVTVVET